MAEYLIVGDSLAMSVAAGWKTISELRVSVVAKAGANLSMVLKMLGDLVDDKPYLGVILHAGTPDVLKFIRKDHSEAEVLNFVACFTSTYGKIVSRLQTFRCDIFVCDLFCDPRANAGRVVLLKELNCFLAETARKLHGAKFVQFFPLCSSGDFYTCFHLLWDGGGKGLTKFLELIRVALIPVVSCSGSVRLARRRGRKKLKKLNTTDPRRFSVGFINVNGIGRAEAYDEIDEFLTQMDVDVFGCVETKATADQAMPLFENFHGTHEFRPKGKKKGGGVSVFVKNGVRVSRMKAGGLGKHEFLWFKILNLPFSVNVMTCYFAAGVSPKDNEWNRNLWDSLQVVTSAMQAAGEGVILVGDFNGWIPDTNEAKVYPSEIELGVKLNGKTLLEFCCFNQFFVLNRDNKCKGKFTRTFCAQKSVIDFVLVNELVYPYLNRMEIFDDVTFRCESDHNFLFVEFDFLPLPPSRPVKSQIGWNFSERSLLVFHEKLSSLLHFQLDIGHIFSLESLSESILATAKSTPGILPRFFGTAVKRVRRSRNVMRLRALSQRAAKTWKNGLLQKKPKAEIADTWQKYRAIVTEIRMEAESDRRAFLDRTAVRVLSGEGKRRGAFWQYCRSRRRKDFAPVVLKDDNGKFCYCDKDVSRCLENEWKKLSAAFAEENSKPRPPLTVPVALLEKVNGALVSAFQVELLRDFTPAFVESVASKIGNKRSVGIDQMSGCFLKNGEKVLYQALAYLFSELYRGDVAVPADWKVSIGTKLNKSGKITEISDYRTVMLNCAMAKLYSACLNQRLTQFVEAIGILSETQHGGRPGRRTSDNVFLLNAQRELSKTRNRQFITAFLDLSKAFDRVDRKLLCEVLELQAVPRKFVGAVNSLYSDRTVMLKMGNVLTPPLPYLFGVIQGDSLSMMLYVLFCNFLSWSLQKTLPKTVLVNNLGYVDDITLMAETAEDMQRLLTEAEKGAAMVRLVFNVEKSLFLVDRPLQQTICLKIGEQALTRAASCKYLGVIYHADDMFFEGNCEMTVSKLNRISGAIKGITKGSFNSCLVGVRLWNAEARPVLEYAMEALPYSRFQLEVLHRIQIDFGRFILKAPLLPEEGVLGETGWQSVFELFARKKFSYAQRCLVLGADTLVRSAFLELRESPEFAPLLASSFFDATDDLPVDIFSDQILEVEVRKEFLSSFRSEWKKSLQRLASKSFAFYQLKNQPAFESYCDGSVKGNIFLQMRTGHARLRWRTYKWDKLGQGKKCFVCGHQDETIVHFLLECSGLPSNAAFIAECLTMLQDKMGPLDLPSIVLCFVGDFLTEASKQAFCERAVTYVYDRWQERTRRLDLFKLQHPTLTKPKKKAKPKNPVKPKRKPVRKTRK